MGNQNWYKDIMQQNYQFDNFYDPTKLFIILALTETGNLKDKYSIYEISQYVYRYYISNLEIAKHNFDIIIRNINKYGIKDIIPYVVSVINQWIREQKYNNLAIYGDFLYLNIENYDIETLQRTRLLCKTLFNKYYKQTLPDLPNYKETLLIDDMDIEAFGKSSIRNLILEEYQYCPLFEVTNLDNLYAVHILPKIEAETDEQLVDRDNLLLLSKEAGEDYLANLFYFDTFGRIINDGSKIVSPQMRLSISLLSPKRKEYILKHLEFQQCKQKMFNIHK